MSTPRNLLNAAYSKSTKNAPGDLAAESTELLDVVARALRGLFSVSARVNHTFFGSSTAAVAHDGVGWPRPADAESIFRIEKADGTEVVVVPFDDRAAESGKPSVYPFGQKYRLAQGVGLLTTDALTFFYSKRPAKPATLDTAIDPMWPEQFDELLILEVALYLAVKDVDTEGRVAEIQHLMAERDRELNKFIAFLEHETVNIVKRINHANRFNTQSLTPLKSLLAAGK